MSIFIMEIKKHSNMRYYFWRDHCKVCFQCKPEYTGMCQREGLLALRDSFRQTLPLWTPPSRLWEEHTSFVLSIHNLSYTVYFRTLIILSDSILFSCVWSSLPFACNLYVVLEKNYFCQYVVKCRKYLLDKSQCYQINAYFKHFILPFLHSSLTQQAHVAIFVLLHNQDWGRRKDCALDDLKLLSIGVFHAQTGMNRVSLAKYFKIRFLCR